MSATKNNLQANLAPCRSDFIALEFTREMMLSPRHWSLVLATRRLYRMCHPGLTDTDFLRHLADTSLDPTIWDAATRAMGFPYARTVAGLVEAHLDQITHPGDNAWLEERIRQGWPRGEDPWCRAALLIAVRECGWINAQDEEEQMAAFNQAGRLVNRRLFCQRCVHFNRTHDRCEKAGYPCALKRWDDEPAWAALQMTGEVGHRLRDHDIKETGNNG